VLLFSYYAMQESGQRRGTTGAAGRAPRVLEALLVFELNPQNVGLPHLAILACLVFLSACCSCLAVAVGLGLSRLPMTTPVGEPVTIRPTGPPITVPTTARPMGMRIRLAIWRPSVEDDGSAATAVVKARIVAQSRGKTGFMLWSPCSVTRFEH